MSRAPGLNETASGTVKPKEKITILGRLAYHADVIMSRRSSQCVALGVIGLIQVMIGGLLFATVIDDTWNTDDHPDYNMWREAIWRAWTYMADPGSSADIVFAKQRLVAALITIGGIIFFAAILGVVCDIITERMTELRKGKSKVVEAGHTVIFGWNDKAVLLIAEICIANESEGGGVVVVLADSDRDAMQIELNTSLPKKSRLGTSVIFRTGSAGLISDLVKVSASAAKSIIALASSGQADESDSHILRCMLSLRSLSGGISGHIVAEVRDVDNEPLVKLVGGDMVDTIVSHDLLGRLMVMSVRQPGLSKVYEAMLGFEGDEFYIQEWPELVGLRFMELYERFPDAVPVGIRFEDGSLELMPAFDSLIEPGYEIIVIAEDNDTYKPAPPLPNVDAGQAPEMKELIKQKEKILFCGWRRDLRDILLFTDSIVQPGSEVHIMTHFIPIAKRTAQLMEEGLDVESLENIKLVHHQGNTSVRKKLEALPLDEYDSCMIFADQEYEADTMHADSHSLATLLLCRDIQTIAGSSRPRADTSDLGTEEVEKFRTDLTIKKTQSWPITCEILDPRTQKTIQSNKHVALSSEFCQTNKLVAQIVSMIAEERSVKVLIDELLGAAGASVEIAPYSRYCRETEKLSFFAVSKRAMGMDEIVIGYQLKHSVDNTILNPPDKEKPMSWGRYDFAVMKTDRRQRCKAKASDDLSNVQVDLDAAEQRRQVRQAGLDALQDVATGAEEPETPAVAEEAGERSATQLEVAPRPGKTIEVASAMECVVAPLRELQQKMGETEWRRIGVALSSLQQLLAASTHPSIALEREMPAEREISRCIA